MAQDHNNIYTIVERLRTLEEGLDKNQRSANQLSATFRPKTVAVLTATPRLGVGDYALLRRVISLNELFDEAANRILDRI